MRVFNGFAIAALFAVAALPAGANGILPVQDTPPVYSPQPASAANWTGGYVGASLGYAFSRALYCDNNSGPPYLCDDPADGLPEPSPEGGLIGITAGYNWQSGMMVYGLVGDLMFGDLSNVVGDSTAPVYGCGGGCGLEVSSIAMLRGRLGYDMGDILPYASLGVAVTHAAAFEDGATSNDGTYTNVVVGLGADYMLTDTLSTGFEVMHLIEGDETIFNDPFCAGCGATNFSATLARVTLAYRF